MLCSLSALPTRLLKFCRAIAALQMFWSGFLAEQGWEVYLAQDGAMNQILCLDGAVEPSIHGTGCHTVCLRVPGQGHQPVSKGSTALHLRTLIRLTYTLWCFLVRFHHQLGSVGEQRHCLGADTWVLQVGTQVKSAKISVLTVASPSPFCH